MIIKTSVFIGILIFPLTVFWITFDSNISKISIKNNYVNFNSYISPSEIDYILEKNNIKNDSYESHVNNKNIIKEYYKNNIYIKNCKLNLFKVINKEEYINNIHEKWFRIDMKYLCKENINNLSLQINTFKDFSNQKYSISLYDLNRSNNKILFKVLTKNDNSLNIVDLNKLENKKTKDSDCDGLNDEEEKIYWTDILKQDTDWDNYSDYEEVKASLEPLNKILWPWQTYRDKPPITKCIIKEKKLKEQTFIQKIISKILNFLKR